MTNESTSIDCGFKRGESYIRHARTFRLFAKELAKKAIGTMGSSPTNKEICEAWNVQHPDGAEKEIPQLTKEHRIDPLNKRQQNKPYPLKRCWQWFLNFNDAKK
jgi:hypothetical protein